MLACICVVLVEGDFPNEEFLTYIFTSRRFMCILDLWIRPHISLCQFTLTFWESLYQYKLLRNLLYFFTSPPDRVNHSIICTPSVPCTNSYFCTSPPFCNYLYTCLFLTPDLWKQRQHFNFASPMLRTHSMHACHPELPLPWDFCFSPAWRLSSWSLLSSKLCMSVPWNYRLINKLIHILSMYYIHFLISKLITNHHFAIGYDENSPWESC